MSGLSPINSSGIPKQLLVGVFALAMLLVACERLFADFTPPGVEILEPDVSMIQVVPLVTVRVKSASRGKLSRVDVGRVPMAFDRSNDTWVAEVTLQTGPNRLVFRSFGEVDPPGSDTITVFHMPFEVVRGGPELGKGIGAHTATALSGGALLITGGSSSVGGQATDEALFLPSVSATRFERFDSPMLTARMGHTATLVDDARVVILGGGTTGEIDSVNQLVESAELFDSQNSVFLPLHVEGDPIRRMYHTASYRSTPEGPVVDVIGGTGDVLYSPQSQLGVRRDTRSFLLRNDTLFALSTAIGPTIEAVTGHTQTELIFLRSGQANTFFVTGFGGQPPEGAVSLLVDYRSPFGIAVDPVTTPQIPRNRHTGMRMSFGIVGLFGGIEIGSGNILSTAEIYVHESRSFYLLPQGDNRTFTPRFGQSATFVPPNRILIIGGFDDRGTATIDVEFFRYTL